MKVLVTGASGFLGGHIAKMLLDRGDEVTCIARRPVNLWRQLHGRAVNLQQGSLPRERFDRVYHFAADVGGIRYLHGHRLPSFMSTTFNLDVLDFCLRNNAELVFPSSVCVYGDQEFCIEGGPVKPTPGYGDAKLFMEQAIRAAVEDCGLKALVVRLDNTFGPRGDYDSARAKAPMAIAHRARMTLFSVDEPPQMDIYASEHTRRAFLSWRQVTEALTELEAVPQVWAGKPINVACGQLTTLKTLAEIALPGGKIVYHPGDGVGAARRKVDIMRFKVLTGSSILDEFDAEGYKATCAVAE